MTTTANTPGKHPVADFAERLETRITELATAAVWSMTPAELDTTLLALTRAANQVEALRLQVLAEADRRGVTGSAAAASAAVYVATETRQTRAAAKSDLKLALAVDTHPVLAGAMALGHANTAQARVIIEAVELLPKNGEFVVTPEQRELAEKHLVAEAEHHDARALKLLGERIFDVICPELADAYEGKKLEAEETIAARKITFTMNEDSQGICHFKGRIPARHGAILKKAMQSLTNPTRLETTAGSPIDTDLPTPVRDGIALTQLLEAIDANWLPSHGGVGATVVVTMTLDQLMGKLDTSGVCALDTGHKITPGEARRLACRAGIIPIVLGGKAVVLDAGTKKRFHSEHMRIALGIKDKGCTADGCDVPPAMCHAHHDIPFSEGGPTSVQNGRLLCGHHHRRIHDPAYEHRIGDDNKITFHRRE